MAVMAVIGGIAPIRIQGIDTGQDDRGSAGDITITLSLGAIASDRETFLAVSGGVAGTTSNKITAATVGAESCTRLVQLANTSNLNCAAIFRVASGTGSALAAATSASVVVSIANAGGIGITVFRVVGAARPLPTGTAQSSGGADAESITLSTSKRGGVIAVLCHLAGADTVRTNWTNLDEYSDFSVSHPGLTRNFHIHSAGFALTQTAGSLVVTGTPTVTGSGLPTTLVGVPFG